MTEIKQIFESVAHEFNLTADELEESLSKLIDASYRGRGLAPPTPEEFFSMLAQLMTDNYGQ